MRKPRRTVIIERTMLIVLASTLTLSAQQSYQDGEIIVLTLLTGMWLFVLAVAAASA